MDFGGPDKSPYLAVKRVPSARAPRQCPPKGTSPIIVWLTDIEHESRLLACHDFCSRPLVLRKEERWVDSRPRCRLTFTHGQSERETDQPSLTTGSAGGSEEGPDSWHVRRSQLGLVQ